MFIPKKPKVKKMTKKKILRVQPIDFYKTYSIPLFIFTINTKRSSVDGILFLSYKVGDSNH